MEFELNKGIGKSAEFKGLKAQYLFLFAAGLLAIFVVFIILYMVGINQWICIGFGVVTASVLVWATFALNEKYGEHGLMKLLSSRQHPRFLINRITPPKTIQKEKKNEKCTKSCHDRKQIPVACGGTRLHHQQGCGYYRRLPGGTAGVVHGHHTGI